MLLKAQLPDVWRDRGEEDILVEELAVGFTKGEKGRVSRLILVFCVFVQMQVTSTYSSAYQ